MGLVHTQHAYGAANPWTFTPSVAPTAGNLMVLSAHTRAIADAVASITGWTILTPGIMEPPGIQQNTGFSMFYRVAQAGDTGWSIAASQCDVSYSEWSGFRDLVTSVSDTHAGSGSLGGAETSAVICGGAVTPSSSLPVLIIGAMTAGMGDVTTMSTVPDTGTTELDDWVTSPPPNGAPGRWSAYRITPSAPSGSYTISGVATTNAGIDHAGITAVFATIPSPGIGWDVHSPAQAFLATLTGIYDQAIRVELNGPGSGHFRINKSDAQATAANLARGNVIRVTIPEIDPDDAIFEFILEEGDFDLVSSKEAGGEELSFGGPGSLVYLKNARIWHTSNVSGSGWVLASRGVWRFEDVSYGYIVRNIIQEGENRSPSPTPDIDVRFGAVVDSDSIAWPTFAGRYEVPIGSTAYDEILSLVEQGRMRVRMDPGYIFRAFNTLGANKAGAFGANTVRFEKGVNIVDGLRRSMNGRAFATHALVRGQDGYVSVASPSYTSGRVVETFIDQSGTVNSAELTNAGEAALELRDDTQNAIVFAHLPGNTPASGLYYPGPAYSANGKYWPGDLVTLHTGTGSLDYNAQTLRIYAVTISYDDAGQLAPPIVELNAPFQGGEPIDNSVVVNRAAGTSGSGASGLHSHPQYQGEAEKGIANGYAALGVAALVPSNQLGTGSAGAGSKHLTDAQTFVTSAAAVDDATIATSDITTNNASTTKHGWLRKLSNVATEFMNGQGNWAVPAGGGSGGYSDLLLDIPPATADADDDEFSGSSLDAAWLNPVTSAAGQTNTIVVAGGWMVLEPATAGSASTGKRVFGIRKVSPTGSFTVSGKVTASVTSTDLRPGLFVAATGGGGYLCGPGFQGSLAAVTIGFTGYSETADWGGYDGVHLIGTTTIHDRHLGWFRIRYDAAATTLYFDYSVNGVVWKNFSSKTSVAQPDRMGVALWSNGATVNADEQFGVGWFRVIDGSAAF